MTLAGDAPPHMDYADDVPRTITVRVARSRRIAVHAIQCGGDPATRRVWKEIAQAGGWDKNPPAPSLSDEIVQITADRYRDAYRRVTGHDLYD